MDNTELYRILSTQKLYILQGFKTLQDSFPRHFNYINRGEKSILNQVAKLYETLRSSYYKRDTTKR
jgi:hypothetical protein